MSYLISQNHGVTDTTRTNAYLAYCIALPPSSPSAPPHKKTHLSDQSAAYHNLRLSVTLHERIAGQQASRGGSRSSRGLELERRGELSLGAVVTGQSVDTRLDENQAELGVCADTSGAVSELACLAKEGGGNAPLS